MRTSIILDDELGKQLRTKAKERGQSLSAFLAEAGRVALGSKIELDEKPFELITYGEGGTYPGINLDKTSELIAAEDERKYGQ